MLIPGLFRTGEAEPICLLIDRIAIPTEIPRAKMPNRVITLSSHETATGIQAEAEHFNPARPDGFSLPNKWLVKGFWR
jgi:hypothetical protein